MIKSISRFEVKINERTYQMLCENDSPLPEAKEALFQFIKYLGQIEDAHAKAQEQTKVESIEESIQEEA